MYKKLFFITFFVLTLFLFASAVSASNGTNNVTTSQISGKIINDKSTASVIDQGTYKWTDNKGHKCYYTWKDYKYSTHYVIVKYTYKHQLRSYTGQITLTNRASQNYNNDIYFTVTGKMWTNEDKFFYYGNMNALTYATNNLYKMNRNGTIKSIIVHPPGISRDLIVTTLSSPSTGIKGNTIKVPNTVKNYGVISSPGFFVKFYLKTIAGRTYYLGYRYISGLAANRSNYAITNVKIPTNIVEGNYYLMAYADPSNSVLEANENNNKKVSTNRINIKGLPPKLTLTGYAQCPPINFLQVKDNRTIWLVFNNMAYIKEGNGFTPTNVTIQDIQTKQRIYVSSLSISKYPTFTNPDNMIIIKLYTPLLNGHSYTLYLSQVKHYFVDHQKYGSIYTILCHHQL